MARERLYELSKEGLDGWLKERQHPAFRRSQIWQRLFPRRATSFADMTELPAALRQELSDTFELFPAEVVAHQVARDRTEKLLLKLTDGELVECVLMRETDRRTICISTQVGCAMGCVFCASGLLGLKRNLTTGEILEQILRLDRLLAPDERLTNIVVMGIGEPLANLKHLLPALDAARDPEGLGLSPRRITISTVGLPEKIREAAHLGVPYNLAVSLHAPNEELRNRLVPINSKVGLSAVLQAADDYFASTGRRITYEYVLLSGVNDSPDQARELSRLLAARIAHVNLIPMNHVTELDFAEPTAPRTREFVQVLEAAGIPVTVRKRKGADIDAACGQLRLQGSAKSAASPASEHSGGDAYTAETGRGSVDVAAASASGERY